MTSREFIQLSGFTRFAFWPKHSAESHHMSLLPFSLQEWEVDSRINLI